MRWRDAYETPADAIKALATKMRFSKSWQYDPDGSVKALDDWLVTPNSTFDWAC